MITKSGLLINIFAISLSFMPLCARGQENLPTGKELFERAAKAIGSQQDLEKINSIELSGKVMVGPDVARAEGADITTKIIKLKGGKGKSVVSVNGRESESFSNGEYAWSQSKAFALPKEWMDYTRLLHTLFVPLEYEKFFDQCTTVRETKFADQACYEVECSKGSKLIATYYFAKDTGLEVGFEMEEPDVAQIYRDYKRVDGIMVAHHVEFQYVGQSSQSMVYDKVTFNVEVDEKQFETPKGIK